MRIAKRNCVWRKIIVNYEEFKDLKEVSESNFVKCFEYESGERFYIEPAFYTQLMYLKQVYPNEFPKVLDEMKRQVLNKKLVSFVYDFENPFFPVEKSIYFEITDITDPIHVYFEDKSRGSDYGD